MANKAGRPKLAEGLKRFQSGFMVMPDTFNRLNNSMYNVSKLMEKLIESANDPEPPVTRLRLSFSLPPDLHKKLLAMASVRDINPGQIIDELLEGIEL